MIDFNLQKDGPALIEDDVDLIWQQIDILFDTTPGDLYGSPNYGTKYDECLYDLKLSAEALEEMIYNDITSIDLRGFYPEISVYLMQGTERDIALIVVDLYRGNTHSKNSYKIT